jgi:hypothetical protein
MRILDCRISIDENSVASRILRYVDLYVHTVVSGQRSAFTIRIFQDYPEDGDSKYLRKYSTYVLT